MQAENKININRYEMTAPIMLVNYIVNDQNATREHKIWMENNHFLQYTVNRVRLKQYSPYKLYQDWSG